MSVRRFSDPINIQRVWDAIRTVNSQSANADIPRLAKYMERFGGCSPAQAELYIRQVADDGLIISINKPVTKNQKGGAQVETFVVPTDKGLPVDDGYDWYCIECHTAGEVLPCKTCYKVFHKECSTRARDNQLLFPKPNHSANISGRVSLNASDMDVSANTSILMRSNSVTLMDLDAPSTSTSGYQETSDHIYNETICSMCNIMQMAPESNLVKEELNHLLSFILQRIKSWVPDRLTNKMGADVKPEWITEAELSWRSGQLFYQHMDMSVIELKLRTREYARLCDFQADVLTIQHNIAIFHGADSQEFGAAELMLRDCVHDISELQNCVDCYKHSNEKINDKWFCFPCRNPHKLVWAKQKGYPHWPAKVIRESDTTCDVRFFGGKYERSILSKTAVRPIETNMSNLQIKKTHTFNKAVEELELHKLLLENPNDIENIMLAKSKPTKPRPSITRKKPIARVPINIIPVPTTAYKDTIAFSPLKNNSVDLSSAEDSFDTSAVEIPKSIVTQPDKKTVRRKSVESPVPSPSMPKKQKSTEEKSQPTTPTEKDPNDVIDISDGDEFHPQVNVYGFEGRYDGSEQVSSSTEYVRTNDDGFGPRGENADGSMQPLDQPYSDAVEKMRRKLELCKDKSQLIKVAMNCMQQETDSINNEHNDHLKALFEAHNSQISETKKKQWCFNCEQDAIYHCCWNTAYCSPTCQQQHWQAEHKKVCRRKR